LNPQPETTFGPRAADGALYACHRFVGDEIAAMGSGQAGDRGRG
jgi:hypothetical protein